MILLRHGQSEFNLHFTATRRDPGIHDPKLTELGHAQAEAAAETLAGERISRIIVSPYTRALQTAAPVARRLGVPVFVNPVVRERAVSRRDGGAAGLVRHAGGQPLGFHPVHDRAERDERHLAALRPDRAGTRAARLESLRIGGMNPHRAKTGMARTRRACYRRLAPLAPPRRD